MGRACNHRAPASQPEPLLRLGAPLRERVLRVLVAIDSGEDLPLVEEACTLADEHNARLELVAGIPNAPVIVAFATCAAALADELERCSSALLTEAVTHIPMHIPVTTRQVRGSACCHLLAEPCRGTGDLLLVRILSRKASRLARRSARSLIVARDGSWTTPGESLALPSAV
jgi:hypothetical protein